MDYMNVFKTKTFKYDFLHICDQVVTITVNISTPFVTETETDTQPPALVVRIVNRTGVCTLVRQLVALFGHI